MLRKIESKVLIVEDVTNLRFIYKKSLAKIGFDEAKMIEAANGVEGLTIALAAINKGEKIDFILTDLIMPGGDGDKFVATLRKIPQFDSTTVFIISSETDKEKIIALMSKKIHAFLVKPLDFKKLSGEVHKYFTD